MNSWEQMKFNFGDDLVWNWDNKSTWSTWNSNENSRKIIIDTEKDVWEDKYLKNWDINFQASLPSNKMLEASWIDKQDLKRKDITSIWWWLWWLPWETESLTNKTNIVDPLFQLSEEKLLKIIQQCIEKNQKKIEDMKEKINKSQREIEDLIDNIDNGGRPFEHYIAQANLIQWGWFDQNLRMEEMRRKVISNNEKNIEYLEKWKKFLENKDNSNIQTIWKTSSWAKSIEDNSQDYIFINFVLDKDSCEITSTLEEAKRILKPWGKIISFNNTDSKLVKYLKENNIKYEERYKNSCGIYFEISK